MFVATTAALEIIAAELDDNTIVLRMAPDEYLFYPAFDDPYFILEQDPYAIILNDSSYFGGWLSAENTAELLALHCEWEPPTARPRIHPRGCRRNSSDDVANGRENPVCNPCPLRA